MAAPSDLAHSGDRSARLPACPGRPVARLSCLPVDRTVNPPTDRTVNPPTDRTISPSAGPSGHGQVAVPPSVISR
ncbi:hypothetical protein HCB17_12735 [Salinispora arenicola]|uniref:hypothetical protein n=1 Tax=Salinispora arenicola TaxID=168697 RepID=UPI0014316B32|nr:hypothetical protein [Salinispora arenicola]NIL41951.1 hypothetical protein [Salinispora arenicola]